jgi:hydroxymethylglutaryl-CoA reductase (NADPH)
MSAPIRDSARTLQRLLADGDLETLTDRLRPRLPAEAPLPERIPGSGDHSAAAWAARLRLLEEHGIGTSELSGPGTRPAPEELAGLIENFVGFARIPVGVAGPLRINGTQAHGDFYVPLATAEGALVASIQRGASLLSLTGGVTAACLSEAVSRAPCFIFDSFLEAGRFLAWLLPRFDSLQEIVATTSRHCRLTDLRTSIVGKDIYLIFDYTTGDAAGQNMVTIATDAICRRLVEDSPVKPRRWYVEGNMSGDKKASMISFQFARGKKAVAEATIPKRYCRKFLHADTVAVHRYWETSIIGGIQSGSIGVQGHCANAIAALFIATGQDAACVSEAAVGVTRMELLDNDDLYVSVNLPNLIVGTVGGATRLPTARECLKMLGCDGDGQARKLAEICAATVLAGELSIIGSLAANDFAQAHAQYGRKR